MLHVLTFLSQFVVLKNHNKDLKENPDNGPKNEKEKREVDIDEIIKKKLWSNTWLVVKLKLRMIVTQQLTITLRL